LSIQKAKGMADVADKVDDTIINLTLAIQNVGVVGDLSNSHLDQIRIAAIYLSASVMDCLTSLIDWVTRSGIFVSSMTVIMFSIEKCFRIARFRSETGTCTFSVGIVYQRPSMYRSPRQTARRPSRVDLPKQCQLHSPEASQRGWTHL
jgi:hypothetical protein